MSVERKALSDEVLEAVAGGSITFTPDSYGATTGRCGIDGNDIYRYESEAAMTAYVAAHRKDKNWTSIAERDQYLISGLLSEGIIK